MDNKVGQIRQGDVLLIPTDIDPATLVPQQTVTSYVMAEGEQTGHAHRLSAPGGVAVMDDMVWVVGPQDGTIVHEDHDPTPAEVIPPGVVFTVVRQREFTIAGQWRQVAD